jgi:hypothetical protein
MKQTLTDMQVEYDDPIPIYFDNTSAISISKNSVIHSKMRHIPIKYHFLQEQVTENNIRVEYVGTKVLVTKSREVCLFQRQSHTVYSQSQRNPKLY